MSDDNSAEAVLAVMDQWYERKLDERYDVNLTQIIFGYMHRKAQETMPSARGSLWDDFYFTMPSKHNYFSWLYGRRTGFISNPPVDPDEEDTLVLTTLRPVHQLIGKVRELAKNLKEKSETLDGKVLSDEDIKDAFAATFTDLEEFTDFCTSYLQTRLLTADLRSTRGMLPEITHEQHARNYKTVREGVWAFAYQMVGDIIH